MEVIFDGYEISFGGDENVLPLIMMVSTQFYEYSFTFCGFSYFQSASTQKY